MRRIHFCNHFHCDPIFTCPQAVHIAESIELARQYVEQLSSDEHYRCILSEMDYLQGWWNIYPERRDDFLRYARVGRFETSGSYSEPNENSIGGEALLRNVVYGQWWLVDYLGATGNVYLPFDVFGHVRQLPQILAKCGFIGTAWTKGSPKSGRGNHELASWIAPDGSRLLNRVASYGGADWGANDQIDGMRGVAERVAKVSPTHHPAAELIFRGSDFISPASWIEGRADELRDLGIDISVPSRYFEAARAEIASGLTPPVTGREMSLYHAGTALSRIELKIGNRLAEHAVLEAETWGALATLCGQPYPEALIDHAWRQILFSQHHDSITGTSNDQSYLDLMSHLREALAEGSEARDGALAHLASRVDTQAGEGRPLIVFNSLNIDRSEPVTASLDNLDASTPYEVVDDSGAAHPAEAVAASDGTRLRFFAEGVPGIGYRTYHLREAEPREHAVEESDDAQVVVETPHERITFDPWRGGGIVSFIEKVSGRELADPGAAHAFGDLIALKEGPGPEPSWEYRTTGERFSASTVRAHVRSEQTPLGWRVTVRHEFPGTEGILRTYSVYENDPRIDCTLEILGYSGSRLLGRDRQRSSVTDPAEHQRISPEDRDLFGLLFPTRLKGVSPRWSDRFGSRVIRRSVNFLDFRTHQDRIESGSGLYSAEEWIAATPDVSISFDGAEERTGIPLGMVRVVFQDRDVLRAAADRLIEALASRGITATPYIDTENQATDPFQTDQIIALGGAGNAWVESHADWSRIDAEVYVRDARPWGDEGKSVPVLVAQGGDERIAAQVDAWIAGLASDRIPVPADAVESDAVTPLDGAGFAVLNRGTIAASCEPDGSLFMALHHAAGWCDWATPQYLGHPFIPERKTSVYQFAVLPFSGTWSDAKTPERAAAYNRPLRVREETRHTGGMPAKSRLADIDAPGSLVSAIKPKGQPSAQLTSAVSDAHDGMLIRLWNWDRTRREGHISLASGIDGACLCDPAERPGEALDVNGVVVSLSVPANSIESLILTPSRAEGCERPAANAPMPPRVNHSRWWLHNAGAAPAGNMPVSVAIRGDALPGAPETVQVSIANNLRDQKVAGTIHLEGPAAWTIEPAAIDVALGPMTGSISDVTVTAPSSSPGRLIARFTHNGMTYVDTLTVGEVPEPRLDVRRTDGGLSVHLDNSTNGCLDFTVTLLTPVEAWPEAETLARVPVAFREEPLTLRSSESRTLNVPLPADFDSHAWAFVKVAYAGVARYVHAPLILHARAEATPGGPITLRAPRADAELIAEVAEETLLQTRIDLVHSPPDGTAPAPLDGVRKYWTIDPVLNAGRIDSAQFEAGIVPDELGVARSRYDVALAKWSGDRWVRRKTEFDERRWTLRTPIDAASLCKTQHWTIDGDTSVMWKTRVGGRFFEAEPYIGDIDGDGSPEVVIGTAANEIVVLEQDGTIRWRRRFTGWIWPSVPFACADVNGDGRSEIVVATNDRSLVLLDCDGRILWRRDDQPFARKAAPTVADITGDGQMEIVISLYDHGVWAYRADGTPLWRAALHPMLVSRPLVVKDGGETALFVNLGGKRLVRLNANGDVVFERIYAEGHATARRAAAPVASNELHPGATVLLVAGHDGQLRLTSLHGDVIWSADIGSAVMGAPAVLPATEGTPPRIVCVNDRGVVHMLSAQGEIEHTVELGTATQGSVVIADITGNGMPEIVIGSSGTPQTHVLDIHGDKIAMLPYGGIWSHTPAASTLCGTPGTIVTGTTDECVVAFTV